MTSACTFLTEEQFRCSICLDIFTDPVSIPCGHNFCKKCITHQWDVINRAECPMCKTVSTRSPELHVNTFISEMAAKFRRSTSQTSRRLSVRMFSNSGEILCDVCTQTKAKAVKSCLMCLTTYCEDHLEPHYRIPGLKRHELIDPVESLEEKMCRSHGKPLEFFCETDQMCVCQKCINLDHKPHRVVPLEEEYERRKTGVGEKEAEIQKLIEERLLKIQQIREKVKLGRKNADREKTNSIQVFSALIQNVENDLAQLLVVIEEKQKATEEQAEGFITELEDEISELETITSEVAMLSHTNDPLQFLQDLQSLNAPAPVKSWKDIQVHSSFEGTARRAVAQLEKRLGQEVENMLRSELKRAQMYAMDVTLDPDTANSKLILKNNGKQVSYSNLKQNLPETPKRFSTCACVLGKESFSAGRFYFEVQVKDKTKWEVGVARESINRKGHITPSPKNGFWAIAGSSVLLSLQFRPERVGVFVDYEEGTVFFYDVDTAALIYSFSGCCFVGKLYPYFRPCNLDNGKNTAPLIIWTVPVTESKV